MTRAFDKRVAGRINAILSDRNLTTKQDRCRYLKAKIDNKYPHNMDISTASLNNILSSRTPLTLERAIVIANSLNIPVSHLLADPEQPNSRSFKGPEVPEIRYDKCYMIIQQCRLDADKYENRDIVDIKRIIRTNLKRLLVAEHNARLHTGYSPASAQNAVRACFKARKPTKKKAACLIASERFFSYITTNYYYNSMGFRPHTLYDVVEGNRSLQLREALVIVHVFDCDLDFKHSAIPHSPALYSKREIESSLKLISIACDEISVINGKINDFSKYEEMKREEERIHLDFSYTDKIHQLNPASRDFSSNTALSLAIFLTDASKSPESLTKIGSLFELKNDTVNDHQLLSPIFGYSGKYPECNNYSRLGKDGVYHRMRCPLCILVNGTIKEIEQLNKDDISAINKMIRGQFQIVYRQLFWDGTSEYQTPDDITNLKAVRQALFKDLKLVRKLVDCFYDTELILGEALSTEFPLLSKLVHRLRSS